MLRCIVFILLLPHEDPFQIRSFRGLSALSIREYTWITYSPALAIVVVDTIIVFVNEVASSSVSGHKLACTLISKSPRLTYETVFALQISLTSCFEFFALSTSCSCEANEATSPTKPITPPDPKNYPWHFVVYLPATSLMSPLLSWYPLPCLGNSDSDAGAVSVLTPWWYRTEITGALWRSHIVSEVSSCDNHLINQRQL